MSRITPKRSLEKLTEEGLVVRYVGKGSFVKGNELNQASILANKEGHESVRALIGVIVTDFGDSYGKDLISGIEQAISGKGFIVLKRTFGSPQLEKEAIEELLLLGVNGLIILPAQAEHFSSEILKLVINDYPVVLVDRYLKGVPAASFSSDNLKAAKKRDRILI